MSVSAPFDHVVDRKLGPTPFQHASGPRGRVSWAKCHLQRNDSKIHAQTLQRREYRTFTNPEGLVLRQLQQTVFAAERPFVWNSIDVGGRMAVIKLSDGSLWVHSPVNLDALLEQALAQIGPVKHIVSPNYEHVKYAQQWIDRYPQATSYACPGLRSMHPEISFAATVGIDNAGPDGWPHEIEVTHLDYEHNPFNGKVFFNEVVFHHVPSKTLLATDFYWNYPDDVPAGTKAWKFGMDKIYHGFYNNFMIKDRSAYNAAVGRILSWDFENILPCHGTYVSKDGKRVLKTFLGM